MPSVIATIKVKQDKLEEAKSFLKELAADTLKNESGTLAYTVHQRKDSPTTFVFYDRFNEVNEARQQTHGNAYAFSSKAFEKIAVLKKHKQGYTVFELANLYKVNLSEVKELLGISSR